MSDFTLDTREFSQALRTYRDATKKTVPEILNRAAGNVAYRAAGYTPKASAARIRSDLMERDNLRYALTSIALKKKGIGALKSPLFAQEVERFVMNRMGSAGYIRSGWADAIIKMGRTFRGKRIGKGHGWATKANLNRFIAEIANSVPGVDKIGTQALMEAVNFVARDMIDYAQRKMQKDADKVSSK